MVTDVTPHREDSPDVEPAPRAGSHRRSRRPRAETALRREAILQAAMVTFGAKGYYNGSLVEVADQGSVVVTLGAEGHHRGLQDRLTAQGGLRTRPTAAPVRSRPRCRFDVGGVLAVRRHICNHTVILGLTDW